MLVSVPLVKFFYSVNYVRVNYSVKFSTVDCKYLLFLQDFFFILKPKQFKKCQGHVANCLKNSNKLTVELFVKKPSEN